MIAREQREATIMRQEARSVELTARMDEAIARLAEQLSEGHTAEFQQFLAFYSRFWTYSIRNTILIHQQCPGATRCAGLKLWNSKGYTIRRGEHAIWIWAPILKPEEDPETGESVKQVVGFIPAPVFDASQLAEIEERPFPTAYPVLPDDVEDIYRLCVAKIAATGVKVEESAAMPPGLMGTSHPGVITIRAGQDSRNRLFTLVHELVHQTWHHDLHDPTTTRAQLEFEAESVAFVVAAVMGLDHPSARDYLLTYQVEPKQLKGSLAVIQVMVRQVLKILEFPFDVMHQPEALVD